MSIFKSFGNAWRGLKVAVKDERNLKIHLASSAVVIALGFYFRVSDTEWIVLFVLIGVVTGFELLNSAIESLTDLVMEDQHPLAGKAKDISAAAVLIVSVISLIVGIIIFAKYIF
jgi:diacylglycerol kinase